MYGGTSRGHNGLGGFRQPPALLALAADLSALMGTSTTDGGCDLSADCLGGTGGRAHTLKTLAQGGHLAMEDDWPAQFQLAEPLGSAPPLMPS